LQKKATDEFKPASTAVLGKVGGNTAEIQSPVQDSPGVLEEECIQGWRISARFAGRNPDLNML